MSRPAVACNKRNIAALEPIAIGSPLSIRLFSQIPECLQHLKKEMGEILAY